MKWLGGEMASFATTVVVSVAIAAVFPYGAVGFRASPADAPAAAAAFVTLSADEEAAAMRAAKTSWQGDAGGVLRLRADLSFGELPEAGHAAVLGVEARTVPPPASVVPYGAPPFLPLLAAPPPQVIPAEPPEKVAPAFSREELLKIERKENLR